MGGGTKIEQILHQCVWLYSKRRNELNKLRMRPLQLMLASRMYTHCPEMTTEVNGNPSEKKNGGWGRQQDDLCNPFQCYTWQTWDHPGCQPCHSVHLVCCYHRSRFFLVSLNHFSWFLMTGQSLFMGPVTRGSNPDCAALGGCLELK